MDTSSCQFFFDNVDRTSESTFTDNSFTYSHSLLKGNHTAQLIIKDKAGNTTTNTWSFHIEEAPPSVSSLTPENGATEVSPTSPITATYSDISPIDFSSSKFYLDGEDKTSVSSFTQTQFTYNQTLSETTHTAHLIIKDTAGNIYDNTWSFSVSQPPQITSLAPADGSTNLPAFTTIYGTYTDTTGVDVNSFRFYLDGIDRTSETWYTETDFTFMPPEMYLSKGNHTARIIISDTLGNTTDYTWLFHIEEDPPQITNITPADGAVDQPATITISATYTDASGIDPWMFPDSCKFYLDGEDKTAESMFDMGNFSYTPSTSLSAGSHTARLIITDTAGNTADTTWSFEIEQNPPAITDMQPEDGSTHTDTIPTISASYTDDISGIDISNGGVVLVVDGEDVSSSANITETTITYNPSSDSFLPGVHNIQLTVKDRAGNTKVENWTFTYISTIATSYKYDETGRVIEITDGAGVRNFTYDANGRLIKIAYSDGTEINYTYDAAGNRTGITYKVGNTTRTIEYEYDENNQITKITDPDGNQTTISYDEVGNIIEKDLPNGKVISYSYDSMGRVVEINVSGIGSFVYSYDGVGNVISESSPDGIINYTYDDIYQLTEADYPDGTTYTYTYDEAGNRTQDKDRTYTYNSLNQLISASDGTGYTYDGDGNLIEKDENGQITTYTWNGDNKLTKIMLPDNSVIQYRYDAEGIRVKKVEDGSEVRYLMDGLSGQIHTESGSLNQPYQYVGGEGYYTEETMGLQLLGQRWYDEEVGRFISRDPIDLNNPPNNLYIYSKNSPLYFTDPNGELPSPWLVGVVIFFLCDPCSPIGEVKDYSEELVGAYDRLCKIEWNKITKDCYAIVESIKEVLVQKAICVGIGWLRLGGKKLEKRSEGTSPVLLGKTKTKEECAKIAKKIYPIGR